jgi:hypothetical protein
MTDIKDQIAELVTECHKRTASGIATRPVALQMVAALEDGPLLRRLAAEFLVDALARARRAQTLESERAAERDSKAQLGETVSGGSTARRPRKGTRARALWEQTPEGRAWADAEWESERRSMQMFTGVLSRALDRYTEEMRIQWTAELLDSTFTLTDGSSVRWGEATVEQHAERRQMFLNNAHANMEGAARHETAIRELTESGADSLREMVGASA